MFLVSFLLLVSIASYVLISSRRRKIPIHIDRIIELLHLEKRLVHVLPGVSTITFLSSKEESSDKGKELESFFRDRVKDIVKLNPWLTGFIGTKDGNYSLCFSSEGKLNESYFTVIDNQQLRKTSSFSEITNVVSPYLVGKVKVNNPDDKLFHVTLIRLHDSQYALVVSISHILGDGATFYSIYNMLNEKTKILALNPERVVEFDEMDIGTSMLDPVAKRWYKSPRPLIGTLIRIIYSMISKLFVTRAIEGGFFKINEAFLEQEKKRNQSEIEGWVSSNDIITSWFLSKVVHDTTPGMMAINFRNKNKILSNDLMGNYIGVTAYSSSDDLSPRGIRRSISKAPDNTLSKERFPSLFSSLSSTWTIITNWAAFYTNLELPGKYTSIKHIPLLPDMKNLGIANVCIIFNTGAGLGVFASSSLLTHHNLFENKENSPIGDEIIPLFDRKSEEIKKDKKLSGMKAAVALL